MSYSTTQRAIRFILFGLAAVPLFAIVFLFASSNMASELVTCVRDGQSTKQAITIKFDEIPALEDWSHEGDQAWNRLLRPGKGGFLLIQKNATDAVPWGISMYHGLHCLKMIRDMMAKAKTTKISNNIHDHSGFEEEHLGHCFAYLAQVSFFVLHLFLRSESQFVLFHRTSRHLYILRFNKRKL